MDKLIIGFSKPIKWMPYSALIMWAYGIPYDHVYIKLHSNTYQRDLVYQASKTLVNFMSSDIFLASNIVIKEFNVSISSETKRKTFQFAIDNVGKPYGTLIAIGLGLVRIAEFFGKTIKNPFNDGGATYVCSELVAEILKELNIIIENKSSDDMTPLDVYNALNNLR